MLQANRSKSHEIKESEKGYYHVLIIRKTHNPEKQTYDIDKMVQIFDKKGFDQFKKFKPADISEVEVLHDPTLKPTMKKKKVELKPETRMVRAESVTLARLSKHCSKSGLVMSWVVTKLIKNWLTKVGVI